MAAAQQAGTGVGAASDNAAPSSWKDIRIPPLPNWTPTQPKRIELANGLVLFLQEDHELPLIAAHGVIRGGSRSEPASKAGMLEIYGDVWRTGGTGNMTGDQMDDYLEARAAKLETNDEQESTSIGFDCLKGDFDDVFRLFVELLRDPAFREDKIQLAKNELNTTIARRNDSSREIADREARKLAYGQNNPYAREPQYATVAAVTRADLLDWYRQHVAPNHMVLGLVGDFDSAQMENKLREAFAGWPRGPQVKKPEIPLQPAKPGLYAVDKADVNQSEIRFVSLGIERRNPDYFAAQVMNQILSGGFLLPAYGRAAHQARPGLRRGRTAGGGVGPSRNVLFAYRDQERFDRRGHSGNAAGHGAAQGRPAFGKRAEVRQGRHPEFVHLPL